MHYLSCVFRRGARTGEFAMTRRLRLFLYGIGQCGLGALLLAFAAYMHDKLSALEAAGALPKMGTELKVIYLVGGKWGVVGLIAAVGLVFLIAGAHRALRTARPWLRTA
jgi:hypothetical protein